MTLRWPRFALLGLLAVTAALYLWNLSINGYGNTFYAAAAQSGAKSWKAWFFGSLDPNNFITVDKPPAALWMTGLSVRLFGMNSWAVLAPQAVMGIAAVAVLYATVRRTVADPTRGAVAGLIAGAVLAVTPAATLMFRYNNPDALMVLLVTVAAYCLMRAVASASWRWLALVGVALGFAFLTKMFAGLMVLPAFALAYLWFAPATWRLRVLHLLGAVAALVVSSGWWIAVVQLWPQARDRMSAGRPTTMCSTSRWATTASTASSAAASGLPTRTHISAVGPPTPGSNACSPGRWATRSPGCCPLWRWRSSSACTWPFAPGSTVPRRPHW